MVVWGQLNGSRKLVHWTDGQDGCVRRIVMVKHATRQQLCDQWPENGICPNILQKLKVLTKDSRTCQAYPSGRGTYEIHDGRVRLPVSINARTCACGGWQISGIPCKHGIKFILYEGKDPVDYISEWFTVVRYKQAYNGSIAPVPDPEQRAHVADVPTLVRPTMKKRVGRPSRNRRTEEWEQQKGKMSTTVKCSKCKQLGHNALTCKDGLTAKETAQQQGKNPQQSKKGKKGSKQAYGYDPIAMNLIDMMVKGTHDLWVDNGTDYVEASNAASQPSRKRKRSKNDNNTEEGEHDLIAMMMENSQPMMQQHIPMQPSTIQRDMTQSSSVGFHNQCVSPKTTKILKRLSQLN